jgi:hypothetical protein
MLDVAFISSRSHRSEPTLYDTRKWSPGKPTATMTTRLSKTIRPAIQSLGIRRLHACTPLRNVEAIPDSESSSQASQRSRAAEAKAKAWYLEEEDDLAPTLPSRSSSGPVFTTYNPMTTLPEPAADIPLQTLPHDVPEFVKPLHAFLTENELFVPHSISFNRTEGSKASKSVAEFPNPQPERGKRRRSKSDSGEGIVIPGHEVGAFWDWVVVAQVAARGKGAVSRPS